MPNLLGMKAALDGNAFDGEKTRAPKVGAALDAANAAKATAETKLSALKTAAGALVTAIEAQDATIDGLATAKNAVKALLS